MTKKQCLIIMAVCVACAIGITLFTQMGNSESILEKDSKQMLCSACGYSFTVSSQEYVAMLKNQRQTGDPSIGNVFQCPNCSKIAVQKSLQCPECENCFIPDWSRKDDYPDRCPKCNFSEIEQKERKQ